MAPSSDALYPFSFLYLFPTDRYQDGFRVFNLELWNGTKKVDSLPVLSGAAQTQYSSFVLPQNDYSGSMRCLPEGRYQLGKIEDAGNGGSWGEGLGRWWVSVEAEFKINDRSAFGIHDDANRSYSKGSAGCVCPFSTAQMERIVGWFKQTARPQILICNLKTGWLQKNNVVYPGSPVTKELDDPATLERLAIIEASDFISEKEGYSDEAYVDPGTGGKPITIGYGVTVYPGGKKVELGDTTTPEQAFEDLKYWVTTFADQLAAKVPGWGKMTHGQKVALISFSYNTGWTPNTPGFDTLNRAIAAQNWKDVPAALRLYINPGSPVEEGLRRRREEEIRYWNQ